MDLRQDLKGASVVPLPEAIATDWCLKSKIRIVSEQEFTWLNMNKPHHEARALATLQQNNDNMVSFLGTFSMCMFLFIMMCRKNR